MTDEQLIEILQSVAKELGHAPKTREFSAHEGAPHAQIYIKRFGSWSKALNIAGIEPNQHRRSNKYTDKQLIEILQSLAKELRRVPKIEELSTYKGAPSGQTYLRRFGSWTKALEIAGCDQCTDEQLIEALQIFADKSGHVPRANDMRVKKGMISYKTYVQRFGSWDKALEMAGFNPDYRHLPHRPQKYTDKQLIEILQSLAKELGHTPTTTELSAEEGAPSTDTYVKRFGSWTKALEMAGCNRSTDEQLIKNLRLLAKKLGHTPTIREFSDAKGISSYQSYTRRFGSWTKALEMARLKVSCDQYIDEQLIEKLQSLAEELGHTPRIRELSGVKGMPSYQVYIRRFSSWTQALKIAGLKPNHRGYQPKHTDDQLIKILRLLAKKLGHTPKTRELTAEEGAPSVWTYIGRFGSWKNALKAAKL